MGKDRWIFGTGIIGLELDARELLGYTDREVKKQMAYANSLALNWTARDVRDDLRARLKHTFTIRNKWTAGSIQMKAASKTQVVPYAEVGSRQDYMRLQAEGGWREKQGGPGA